AHPYAVTAVKSGQPTRLPAAGQLDGPVVNTLPAPALTLATSGSIATTFAADARASSDAETATSLLESRVAWGDGETTAWRKGLQHSHQYRATGSYAVTLWVRDASGESASLA